MTRGIIRVSPVSVPMEFVRLTGSDSRAALFVSTRRLTVRLRPASIVVVMVSCSVKHINFAANSVSDMLCV